MKPSVCSAILGLILMFSPNLYGDIAFFYALDSDLREIKKMGQLAGEPVSVGQKVIHRLSVGRHRVYACKMGSGAVETALSVQAVLARFPCSMAISTGPAADLAGRFKIGEWVLVTRVIPWQTDQADRSFDLSLTEENRRGLSKKHRWRSINEARLVSGEAFVADEGLRTRLAGDYQADLVDMNSFGLAAACRDHRIPLLVFRVISDRGDSKAGADFRKFTESYDGSGGALTGAFLENLPPSPDRPDSYDAIRELIDRGVAPSS